MLSLVLRDSHASAQCPVFAAHRSPILTPRRDEFGFIKSVSDVVQREQIQVLLPVSDVTTLLTTQHRHRINPLEIEDAW